MLAQIYFFASLFLQIIALFLIFRLARVSGFKFVWWIFALAIIFRIVRSILFIIGIVLGEKMSLTGSLGEVFGFFVSCLLIIALYFLLGIFKYFNGKLGEMEKVEEKYKAVLHGSHDGIIIVQDSVIKFVNPRILEMLGYDAEHLLGKNYFSLIAPPFRRIVEEKHANRLAGRINRIDQYEMAYLKKDRAAIDVGVGVSLIDYEDKPAVLVIARDISGRKKQELKSEEFGDELLRINQTLIGRELKMAELKKENEELKALLEKLK